MSYKIWWCWCRLEIDNPDRDLVLLLLDNTSATPKTVKWLRERSARAVCSVPLTQPTHRPVPFGRYFLALLAIATLTAVCGESTDLPSEHPESAFDFKLGHYPPSLCRSVQFPDAITPHVRVKQIDHVGQEEPSRCAVQS